MAKEKKRGFFSWLGFGQKEQAQETETEQKVEEQQAVAEEIPAVETPAEPSAPKADPEAFAEDVVEVTETVVESEKAHLAEPASAQEEEWVETPALTEETPVVEPEPAVSEPPEQPAVVEPLAEEVIAEPVVAEAVAEQPVEGIVVQPQETEAPEEDAPLSDEELEAQALAAEAAEEAAVVVPAPEDEAPLEALAQEQEKPTKEGFFARLKRSLLKTKQNLGSGFISLFRGKKIDDDLFEELEEQLLIADVGVETTRKIITNLTEGASRKQLRDAEALYGLLKEEMGEILAKVDEPLNVEGKTPFVILMVGVNGVGKTTTIGKLARQFEQQGKSVMLAAACLADGTSYIRENVFESRFCTAKELQKLGAHIIIEDKLAVVCGVPLLRGAQAEAADLRGGAALVVACLAAEGESLISGYGHISRGYEDIRSDLAGAGARISLIG